MGSGFAKVAVKRSCLPLVCICMACLVRHMDCYREHLMELEHVISECGLFGSVGTSKVELLQEMLDTSV